MKKVKKLEKKIEGLREEIQTLHLESRLEIEDHFQATYFKGLPLTRVSSYDFDEIKFELPKLILAIRSDDLNSFINNENC